MRQARLERHAVVQAVVGWAMDAGARIAWTAAVVAAVPIGLAVLLVSAVVAYGLAQVVGWLVPSTLAGPLLVAWIAGTGVIVVVVWVRLYRRLPERIRDAANEPVGDGAEEARRRDPRADPDTVLARLAALDRRLDPDR